MAKIISTILKGPGALFDEIAGTGKKDKPSSRPAPAAREDTAEAGADARRDTRRRRGRASTILSSGNTGNTPARKSVLGGG